MNPEFDFYQTKLFQSSLATVSFFFLLMYAGATIVILGLHAAEPAITVCGVVWAIMVAFIFRKRIPLKMLLGALVGVLVGAVGGALLGMLIGNAGDAATGVAGGALLGAVGGIALFALVGHVLRYLPASVGAIVFVVAVIAGAILGTIGIRDDYPRVFGAIGGMAAVGGAAGMIAGLFLGARAGRPIEGGTNV